MNSHCMDGGYRHQTTYTKTWTKVVEMILLSTHSNQHGQRAVVVVATPAVVDFE